MDGWSQANLQGAPVLFTEEAWPLSPGILSTAGPDWPGIPAGRSSTPAAQPTSRTGSQEKKEPIEETPGDFTEPAPLRTSVQERAGRPTRGSRGSLWPSPPSQELESRVGASSGQGGLEEAIGELQEDSQTSGSFSEPTASLKDQEGLQGELRKVWGLLHLHRGWKLKQNLARAKEDWRKLMEFLKGTHKLQGASQSLLLAIFWCRRD